MTSILRGTLAALTLTSTVWLAVTPAAADDYETCAKASGDQAIAACTRAIDSGRYSGRQLAVLFTNRCVELNDTQSDKAIADCSQAIRLDPNGADAFSGRAGAYRAKRQYDRAIEDFNQTIRLSPNEAIAFYNRGMSWERKNDLQRALADFKTFTELATSDPDGPRAIARVTKALSGRHVFR
jgi:tetratricopeptide (TPR) repeat protein